MVSLFAEDKDTVNYYDVRITFDDVVRVTAATIGFKNESESQEELENALHVSVFRSSPGLVFACLFFCYQGRIRLTQN